MARHLDVFVSSTSRDLIPYRTAVREAILDLHLFPIMMENFPAEGVAAVTRCRRAVDRAEIFVGLYARRYGWIPTSEQGGDGTHSITALEYIWARERGIPVLCFVLDDECEWPDSAPHVDDEPEKADQLAAFKGRVMGEVIVKHFTTPDSLKAGVLGALINAVKDITGEERKVGDWRRPVGPPLEYNFVGRADDQDALTHMLADGSGSGPVTVVSGTGGIGKTFLAKHMAQALDEQFPGGVLWVSMGPEARHAETEVPRVLSAWAHYHEQGRTIPYDKLTVDRVRGLLADAPGRLLVVFDDVWFPAPVTELRRALPPDAACLVTTRLSQIAALGRRYPLERLIDADARALIEDRLHVAKIDPEPLSASIGEIVALLNGHALALDLAARQIAMRWQHKPDRYIERLRDNLDGDTPFADLQIGEERDFSLEAALALSYDHLTGDQQQKYRALGVLAPDTTFSEETAFATWGVDAASGDLPQDARRAAEDALLALVNAGLVRQPDDQPDRYEQHMLLRTYAAALARRADEYDAALGRYSRHVIDDIAGQFRELPPEAWDAHILIDKDHIHHLGDSLAGEDGPDGVLKPGYVQAIVLGDVPLESLAQPEPPENLDDLRQTIVGDNPPRMVAALIERGSDFAAAVVPYVFQRRVAEGRRWLQCGLACARLAGNRKRESLLVGQLGSWHDQRGEKRASLAYQEAGLEIDRELGDQHNVAVSLNNIGGVYSALGDKQQALRYYEQALPIQRQVGDRAGEATTLNNIGLVYDALGDKQQALRYYQQALPIRRQVGDRAGEATTLNNIGSVYDALGDKQQALRYYEQALAILREIGDRAHEAGALNNIGMVYSALGDKQQALRYYEQALPIQRQVGDRAGEATTLNNIGLVYDALGDKQQALRYYEQALPIRRDVGDRMGEAVTCYNIGLLLHREFGRTEEAIRYLERCVQLDEETGHPDLDSDRATLEQLRRIARGATSPPGPLSASREGENASPQMDAQTQAIAEAIVAFVNTPDWDAARQQLEARKEVLLTDAADRVFGEFIAQQDDPKIKEMLEYHRALVRACRQMGIDEAFRRIGSGGATPTSPPTRPQDAPPLSRQTGEGENGSPQMDAQTRAAAEAVIAFVTTPDWDAARAQLEAHRDLLLSDAADRVFAEFIAEAESRGDTNIKEALENHRALLRACRRIGIDEAFRRIGAGGAEPTSPPGPPASSPRPAASSPQNPQHQAIFAAIQAVIVAEGGADGLRAAIEAHAALLFPQTADAFLEQIIPQQDDPQIRAALESLRAVLQLCREVGIAEAFRRLAADQ